MLAKGEAVAEARGTHGDLHGERGRRPGEHRGRAANPLAKVQDIAWLEFRKPDLVRAEAFAHDFGFTPRCAPLRSCTCAVSTEGHPA